MKKLLLFFLVLVIAIQFSGCLEQTKNPPETSPVLGDRHLTPSPSLPEPTPTEAPAQEDEVLRKLIEDFLQNEKGTYSIGVKDLMSTSFVYINDIKMRSASVIKLYVMIAAYSKIKAGELDPKKQITLTEDMKVGGTGILVGAKNGTQHSIERLIELMMTVSDNTASNILVKELGFESINDTIASLGCKDTVLGYYFILKPPEGVTNTTSARDLNLVFEKLYTNQCLGEEYDLKMLDIMSGVKNTTKLPSLLPPGTRVAHKTGSVIAHEHDAGIVFGPSRHFAVSILSRELPNPEKAKKVIAQLSKLIFDYYNN